VIRIGAGERVMESSRRGIGKTIPATRCVGAVGRRSIARDGLKGGAIIQKTRIIVNAHREQARSYRGGALIQKTRVIVENSSETGKNVG
jgi:hypothetical protein